MKKIRITQVKSVIDRPSDQKRTIRALGITHNQQTVEHESSPAVDGMINKVKHLLKVEEVD
ncbi:MAG: 50S ribosomal protein L30 [Bacteroidales bacterium]